MQELCRSFCGSSGCPQIERCCLLTFLISGRREFRVPLCVLIHSDLPTFFYIASKSALCVVRDRDREESRSIVSFEEWESQKGGC